MLVFYRHRLKPEYFKLSMLRDNPENATSLNFQQGIVLSKSNQFGYLTKHRERNDIEDTIRRKGAWAPHLLELADTLLTGKTAGIILDVGANVGAFTIPLAKKHPHLRFQLYEPHPDIVEDLKDNIGLNQLENCKLHAVAVTDLTQESVRFHAQETQSNMGLSSLLPNFNLGDHKTILVRATTLDEVLTSEQQGQVKLLKIDTQGTELNVLRSARVTIERSKPAIIFELEGDAFFGDEVGAVREELRNFFSDLNYGTYAITSRTNYMPCLDLTKFYSGDVLAMPKL